VCAAQPGVAADELLAGARSSPLNAKVVRRTRVANVNIEELEEELPNGLHDALLRTFSSSPSERRAEFLVEVWVGDLHSSVLSERERRRSARLELLGLTYLIVDDVARGDVLGTGPPVQISACAADENADLARQVPEGGFAARFFVTEWNAFIHFAAAEARLTWLAAN
jgi:hypothetical protein